MIAGTGAYRKTVEGVLDLLNGLDPYDLQPGTSMGAPRDEYEMEAGDLACLLLTNGAVTSRDVDVVWRRWFSEPLTLRLGEPQTMLFVARLNAVMAGVR